MNATQLKYARERIDAVVSEKTSALNSRYRAGLTEEQKIAALKKGEFSINKKATSLKDAIVYTNAPAEMTREEYQAEYDAIRARATAIKDELVLGDHGVALQLIQQFRSED